MRTYFIAAIIALDVAMIATIAARGEEPRRPTALDLNQQLLESEVRNYRQAVAQLSEANQKLQDQLVEAQKKCSPETQK